MSSLNKVCFILAAAIIAFGLALAFCSIAGCTLRVDPNIDPPQIEIGCVIVEIGQSTVEMCPDAGGQAVPSHNIAHPLDAGAQ